MDSVIKEFLFRAAAAGVEGFDQALFEQYKLESAARKEAEKAKKELISKKSGGLMSVEDVAAQHHSTGHNNNTIRRTQSLAVLGREVAEAVKLRNPLKMFFPFDPYLLRRSAALLRLPQNYVTWQGNARDDEDGSTITTTTTATSSWTPSSDPRTSARAPRTTTATGGSAGVTRRAPGG